MATITRESLQATYRNSTLHSLQQELEAAQGYLSYDRERSNEFPRAEKWKGYIQQDNLRIQVLTELIGAQQPAN